MHASCQFLAKSIDCLCIRYSSALAQSNNLSFLRQQVLLYTQFVTWKAEINVLYVIQLLTESIVLVRNLDPLGRRNLLILLLPWVSRAVNPGLSDLSEEEAIVEAPKLVAALVSLTKDFVRSPLLDDLVSEVWRTLLHDEGKGSRVAAESVVRLIVERYAAFSNSSSSLLGKAPLSGEDDVDEPHTDFDDVEVEKGLLRAIFTHACRAPGAKLVVSAIMKYFRVYLDKFPKNVKTLLDNDETPKSKPAPQHEYQFDTSLENAAYELVLPPFS